MTPARLWQRYVLPALIIIPIYFLFLAYPPLRLMDLLRPDWQPGTAMLLTVFIGPALGRLSYEWRPGPSTRRLSALALTWCGLCFVALCLLLPFEVLNAVLDLPRQASGLVLLGAVAALGFIGVAQAQLLPVRKLHLTVPRAAWPEGPGRCASRPLQFAQISDVHIGSREPAYLRRVVRRVAELPVDYVLITGDLIDFRDISLAQLRPLGDLPVPVLFCIGNHERYVDLEDICERLRRVGVIVLRNESITLNGVQFIGIDDAERRDQVARHLPAITPEAALRVLLYHRPDGAEAAQQWGAHLMFCGHTHNGQIKPFNLLVRRQFARIAGLYRIGDLQLYVSPGTGTWGPVMRLGTCGEVTWVTVRSDV
ncbi:MAG: metallophosphoesterase [Pseudomonadota bacterium]